jgi:hypothetical protein
MFETCRGSIKYYLLRSFAVCAVLLSALSYTHMALAVSPDMQISAPPPAVIIDPEDVLWDQTDNIADMDITSQDFIESAFDIYDTRAADDFLVPDGVYWSVRTVRVIGMFDMTVDPPDSLDVLFYRDDDGLPGSVIGTCRFEQIQPEDENNPSFIINLPRPCRLLPGKHWVSVRANMFFLADGQWFWNESTEQRLSPFVWENPGNGFGTGCLVFSPAQADCGATHPDLSFLLIGEEHSLISPVPTMSELGLIFMAAILGLTGIAYSVYARRRNSRTKSNPMR